MKIDQEREGNQLVVNREDIKKLNMNIDNRTIIIGFNEPRLKKMKGQEMVTPLNARFITYFLPAVDLARNQERRPRFFIVSGINSALKWNARNDEERKIMLANNAIKFDFLRTFFEKYFRDVFSLVEYIIPQDILKIPEERFLTLWKLIEEEYGEELMEVKFQLTKYLYPKKFNVASLHQLSDAQKRELHQVDASLAFKYAITHLFIFGDINFEGNYFHDRDGYVSIGAEPEMFFNIVRNLVYRVLKENDANILGRDYILFDNMKIVYKNKHRAPVPYNGLFDEKKGFLEVTYENERKLDYYDTQEKLKDQMDYMYKNLLSREEYQKFWDEYRERYFDLKERYKEAYHIESNW